MFITSVLDLLVRDLPGCPNEDPGNITGLRRDPVRSDANAPYSSSWKNELTNIGVAYGQDPGSMTPSQLYRTTAVIGGAGLKDQPSWDWYQQLMKQSNAQRAADREMELQMAMAESYAAMAEAANRVVPSVEPLKQAPEQYTAAQSDTARKQQMRSGLLSAFNRYGGGALRTNALQNKADKLGAA